MSQNKTCLSIGNKFEYNGVAYTFDLRDADDAERYEDAVNKMGEEEHRLPKVGRVSEIYKGQCELIKKFFDRVLGDGAGDALCTAKNNVGICYNAYEAFLSFVSAQKDSVISTRNTFSRYSNRDQRRHPNTQNRTNFKTVK